MIYFLKFRYKEYLDEARKKLSTYFNKNTNLWDPSGSLPNLNAIKEENVKEYARYLFLKNNPNYSKKVFLTIFITSVFIFMLSFFIDVIFRILAISFLILTSIIFYLYLYMMRKDIIKLIVAIENNFLYWPNPDRLRWINYFKLFPEIFNRGDKNQSLEDIFWGEIDYENRKNYFVSGIFNYTITSYDSENREKDTKYTDHFFIIKLNKKLNSRFYLYPQNIFSKVKNLFVKKDIKLESLRFNSTFSFSYNGKKDEKAIEIVKTLSPRVIEELLKLYDFKTGKKLFKKSDNFSVLFTNDCVVFYFSGYFIENLRTNFAFSNKISEKDKIFLDNELKTMIKLGSEMVKYLD
jgi:hypothetical protein